MLNEIISGNIYQTEYSLCSNNPFAYSLNYTCPLCGRSPYVYHPKYWCPICGTCSYDELLQAIQSLALRVDTLEEKLQEQEEQEEENEDIEP